MNSSTIYKVLFNEPDVVEVYYQTPEGLRSRVMTEQALIEKFGGALGDPTELRYRGNQLVQLGPVDLLNQTVLVFYTDNGNLAFSY